MVNVKKIYGFKHVKASNLITCHIRITICIQIAKARKLNNFITLIK